MSSIFNENDKSYMEKLRRMLQLAGASFSIEQRLRRKSMRTSCSEVLLTAELRLLSIRSLAYSEKYHLVG